MKEGGNIMETEDVHRFRVTAWRASGRTGIAQSSSAPNVIHFADPPAFGGLDGRWSPEDLLLCAIASCYTTTFESLAEKSKLAYTDLQVEAEGEVDQTGADPILRDIVMRATLILPREADRGTALLQRAHALCLVSRALAVAPRFEAHVHIGELSLAVAHAVSVSGKQVL
jgi:organic hydroperoxide reductase OsmC/OhrA